MPNLLSIAGLSAAGGIIASSWSTIRTQLNKIKSIVFVTESITPRVTKNFLYLFLLKNYKISPLELKSYVRNHEGGYCEYYNINNTLIFSKSGFFWISIEDRTFRVSYIRGLFDIKKFISKFNNYSEYRFRTWGDTESKVNAPNIEYITGKFTDIANLENSSRGQSNSPSSELVNTGFDYIDVVNLHESIKATERNIVVGELYNTEYKSEYIPPKYLNGFIKEFLNWSGVDIYNLFNKTLSISSAKGYCLHGIPGTGKSSFIKYLAEQAGGMKIEIIQLNSLTAKDLIDYFRETKDNRVIRVIEDIDSVFNLRERVDKRLNSTDLTFDVLLNCLSGVDSPTAGFTFVTTNHLDRVDPALLRAGRLDNIIEIKIPDKEDYENIYNAKTEEFIETFVKKPGNFNFMKLEDFDEDTMSKIKQDIDNNKSVFVDKAYEEKHTTAQFTLDIKNKIADLYIKYRNKHD